MISYMIEWVTNNFSRKFADIPQHILTYGWLQIFLFSLGIILTTAPSGIAQTAGAVNIPTRPTLGLNLTASSHSTPHQTVSTAESALAKNAVPLILRHADESRPRLFEPIPRSAFNSGITHPPSAGSGLVPEGLGFDLGAGARPYVVKYACCTDLELYAQPSFGASVVGTMAISSEVWVFDFFGAGLPSGIATCGTVPSPCPHIWAEVFSNDLSRSGYVPLSSLFNRPMTGEVGSTTFEISFRRLNNELGDALQSTLIRPPGCNAQDDVITVRGFEHGYNDLFFSTSRGDVQICQPLIDHPFDYKLSSCSSIAGNNPVFAGCIYQTKQECFNSAGPNRAPSQNLWMCVPQTDEPIYGAGTCGSCRQWYEETGQWNSGSQPATVLVDQCLSQVECQGSICEINDVPCQGNGCTNLCEEWSRTYMGAACGNYVGPRDTKYFGNPVDYRCGEVPVGTTHPLRRYDTANEEITGEPDPNNKLILTWGFPNPQLLPGFPMGSALPVSVMMGRLDDQKPFSFSIPDLSTHDTRHVQSPAQVNAEQLWYRLWPEETTVAINGQNRRVNALTIRFCGFLPGNRIDLGEATFRQNEDSLWPIIKSINFGVVEFDHLGLCTNMRAYLNPNVSNVSAQSVTVEPASDDDTHVDIPDTTIRDIDFGWGGSVMMPLVDGPLQAVAITVEHAAALFNTADSSFERRVINMAKSRYADRLINAIEPEINSAITNALNDARTNTRESLSDVCAIISPDSPPNHPFHFYYRYVRWNCSGMATNNLIRPFLRNAASTEQGCYDRNEFITPADAGRTSWWTTYMGQEWYWAGWPDSGCRLAAEISSRPDRAIWEPLRCATFVFNAWFNRGPSPLAELANMVASSCRHRGENSLRDLYGSGDDLVDLYRAVHPPNGRIAPADGLRFQ